MTSAPISVLLERKNSEICSVSPAVTVAEAVTEMNRRRIGSVVVLEGGRLAGIFTERDVLRRVVGAGIDPLRTSVAEVMTAELVTVKPTTTVDEAMEIFTDKRCRHLPVLDDGRLVGLLSIGDVTRWSVESHRSEAEHLKNYIAGGFSA
jgi:CBS domain-containing protein